MDEKQILDFLCLIQPFDKTVTEMILKHAKQNVYRKGQPVKVHVKDCNFWFVSSGLLKGCYFDSNGREYITRFWQKGETAVFKNGSTALVPRAEYLIMLEECTLVSWPDRHIEYLLRHYPQLYAIKDHIIHSDLYKAEQLGHLLVLPLAAAYEKFMALFPAHKISIKDTGCYLGVDPKRISELRKKK